MNFDAEKSPSKESVSIPNVPLKAAPRIALSCKLEDIAEFKSEQ